MNKKKLKKLLFENHPDRGGDIDEFIKIKREYDSINDEYDSIKNEYSYVLNNIMDFEPKPTHVDYITRIVHNSELLEDCDHYTSIPHMFNKEFNFVSTVESSFYTPYFHDIYMSGYLVPGSRIVEPDLNWDESITFWLVKLSGKTMYMNGIPYKIEKVDDEHFHVNDPLFPCTIVRYREIFNNGKRLDIIHPKNMNGIRALKALNRIINGNIDTRFKGVLPIPDGD